MLAAEDFADDKKDAGELGAGHTVTALYEVVLNDGSVDPIQNTYTETTIKAEAFESNDLATLRFRYKQPEDTVSKLITKTFEANDGDAWTASENFRFSAAVAQFGMLLRESQHKGEATFDDLIAMAEGAQGKDEYGYRSEFVYLAKRARELATIQ